MTAVRKRAPRHITLDIAIRRAESVVRSKVTTAQRASHRALVTGTEADRKKEEVAADRLRAANVELKRLRSILHPKPLQPDPVTSALTAKVLAGVEFWFEHGDSSRIDIEELRAVLRHLHFVASL